MRPLVPFRKKTNKEKEGGRERSLLPLQYLRTEIIIFMGAYESLTLYNIEVSPSGNKTIPSHTSSWLDAGTNQPGPRSLLT
jgi:hypothetical protein